MKKLLFLLFVCPVLVFGQESLSLNDILTINSKDAFLKVVIENGYSQGNSSGDKIYYGKGLSKDKAKATDWAEYTMSNGEFYFEQSNLSFVEKNGNCYYNLIVADIKKNCEFTSISKHSGKAGDVDFATYNCPGAKFKGSIGFAQVHGNGVVQEFPE